MHFMRQYILNADIPISILKSYFKGLPGSISWRVFWIEPQCFLCLSWWKPNSVPDEINIDSLSDWIKRSDEELQKAGRVIAVIYGCNFQVSVLAERVATILVGNRYSHLSVDNPIWESHFPVMFRPEAAAFLPSRMDGVSIYFEALNSHSDAKSFIDYFRVVERGFGRRGSRLEKPVIQFLSGGRFRIEADRWAKLKNIRDRVAHAYDAGQAVRESEVFRDLLLMKHISADVLLHKSDWGEGSVNRVDVNYFSAFTELDGEKKINQGMPLSLTYSIKERISGFPVFLGQGASIERYNRLQRAYFSAQTRLD